MAAKNEKKTAKKDLKQKAKKHVVETNTHVIEAQEALEAEKNKFLRLFADFENYKKRTAKERIELFKTASQEVMVALLPVLDDFDRALSELDKADDTLTGIQLIYNKIFDILKQQGLTKIEIESNTVFDPELHEAITQLPASEDHPKGSIVDVVSSGYKLGDLIIRYPKVVVAQ